MIFPIEEVLSIHRVLIDSFGGSQGLRDGSLLKAALQRPLQTFDGHELYPSEVQKSAALLESIVKNHPFIDGNKRTGYVLARLYLMEKGWDIIAPEQEKYRFIIAISENKLVIEEVVNWLKERLVKR